MATIVTHFIVGSSIALPFCRDSATASSIRPWAVVVSAGLLSFLADLDVMYMHWVPYRAFLGHRGFWHSPFAGILISVMLAVFVGLLVRNISARAVMLLAGIWAAACVSHPLLDAMTDGGLGVMMFFPCTVDRFFFTWRPIHVAMIGISAAWQSFLSVFPSEMPFCALALALGYAGFTLQTRKCRSVKTIVSLIFLCGLCGVAGCAGTETSTPRPAPTEAQKKALLEANEILTACEASDTEKVKALLEKNTALVNAQDDAGATPLSRAVIALKPNAELVRLLLEKGAQIEGAAKNGGRPLRSAALLGRKDLVVMLLQHGAKIGAQDQEGRTALEYAASANRIEVADVLLAHGAQINVFEAAALGKTKKLEGFLRSEPKSARARDARQGLTPLHWAAMHGHTEAVRLLLAHGASAFQESRYGYSPCFFAREYKHPDIVALLRCP